MFQQKAAHVGIMYCVLLDAYVMMLAGQETRRESSGRIARQPPWPSAPGLADEVAVSVTDQEAQRHRAQRAAELQWLGCDHRPEGARVAGKKRPKSLTQTEKKTPAKSKRPKKTSRGK